MRYPDPPSNVRSLEQRLRNIQHDQELVNRRRISMALVVVGQMLPQGVVKGGSALALRYGSGARFTRDLDVSRIGEIEEFCRGFEDSLSVGWAGFTGRLIRQPPPRPRTVPPAYVMQPFDVKLDYRGRPWCTVRFELGHHELGDTHGTERHLADEIAFLFTEIGLGKPSPVAVLPLSPQIAQKLHAVSAPNSDRAHDLVDLQMIERNEDIDLLETARTCRRLFRYRQQQPWPPTVVAGPSWDSLYLEAAKGIDVLPTLGAAVTWVNGLIARLDSAR